jgi:uncharacterized protein (TIGR03790 family)
VLLAALAAESTALAIDPSRVLLLYNAASQDGIDIKDHYLSIHAGIQTLAITGLGTSESITADTYLGTLRPQVLAALTPDIDLIITTKGLPLRIQVTQPQPPAQFPNLPTYTDPWGQERQILNWRPYSSLESELAAIDTISIWEMMGDQSYALEGHFTQNPYYNATTPFSHADYGTRLTARLDGYTVEQVTEAVNRAQNAFVGPANSAAGPFHFVVDNDDAPAYQYTMTRLVNDVLNPAGMPVTYDSTQAFVSTAPGPVIGYDNQGVHPYTSNPPDYINSALDFDLADGAVFTSIESYNAYSFNVGGYGGAQGQVAEWLEIGGTAGVGYVEEPIASWVNVSNEDLLFKNLLAGMTFAEAAWSANYQVSYVNTLVGDPLMAWRTLTFGDLNRDGFVDITDLAIMGAHWNDTVQPGGYGWGIGDLNSDGAVDITDLAIMGAHWGDVSPWATGDAELAGFTAMQLSAAIAPYIQGVPEPSTGLLLALGVAALAAYRAWRVRRLPAA